MWLRSLVYTSTWPFTLLTLTKLGCKPVRVHVIPATGAHAAGVIVTDGKGTVAGAPAYKPML